MSKIHPSARWTWAFLLTLTFAFGWLTPARAETNDYKLGYGDALTISIVGQPSLSVDAQPVRPDGKVSLPLVHDLSVAGKTVPEVTAALNRAYRAYLANPQVLVTVAKFRPIRVTVLGQVTKPGTFAFEGMPTLVDALATAGGMTDRASRQGIRIIPVRGPAVTYALDDLLLKQTAIPRLQDGDVVEISEVWGPDLYRIVPIVASVITATGVVLRFVVW